MKMIEYARILANMEQETYETVLEMASELRAYRSTIPGGGLNAPRKQAATRMIDPEKPKRKRRTKAEMEALRAQEALKTLEKVVVAQEQERVEETSPDNVESNPEPLMASKSGSKSLTGGEASGLIQLLSKA